MAAEAMIKEYVDWAESTPSPTLTAVEEAVLRLREAPAGSIVLFTEALTHGTAAWRGPHERRALLYKYCVSHVAWTAKRVAPPTTTALTLRQQILFCEPGDPHIHFPSLFEGVDAP